MVYGTRDRREREAINVQILHSFVFCAFMCSSLHVFIKWNIAKIVYLCIWRNMKRLDRDRGIIFAGFFQVKWKRIEWMRHSG